MLDDLQHDDLLIAIISTRNGTEVQVCISDPMQYWTFISQFALGRRFDIDRKVEFFERVTRITRIIAEALDKAAEARTAHLARAFAAYDTANMISFRQPDSESSTGVSTGYSRTNNKHNSA